MVLTKVDLNAEENKIVNVFMATHDLPNKEQAIKKIIRESSRLPKTNKGARRVRR